jgi:hypothetical protein
MPCCEIELTYTGPCSPNLTRSLPFLKTSDNPPYTLGDRECARRDYVRNNVLSGYTGVQERNMQN